MAYITRSNLNNVIRKIDKQKLTEWVDDIYTRKINFVFSQLEKKELHLYRQLFLEPASFVKDYLEKYIKYDTMTYVDKEKPSAFHKRNNCPRLLADFDGDMIPPQIQVRGKDEVEKFRKWFKHNSQLLERPEGLFYIKLAKDFNIETCGIDTIHYKNSGVKYFGNLKVSNVNEDIDTLLLALDAWLKNDENYEIIVRYDYGINSFLYNREIGEIPSGLTEEQIKRVLKEFIDKFKTRLYDLLVLSYRIECDHDLSFDETILEQLGFKPCVECGLDYPD